MQRDPSDIDSPDARVANERLTREGGVFVQPPHYEVDCNTDPGSCAPDDYPEDPYAIDNRPGTVDDIGYSYGVDADGAEDLWRSQRALREEDELNSVELPEGADEADGRRLLDLMGDETADAMPEGDRSSSATGEATSAPEHGGFPERPAR
jgi:hypothetical protein